VSATGSFWREGEEEEGDGAHVVVGKRTMHVGSPDDDGLVVVCQK